MRLVDGAARGKGALLEAFVLASFAFLVLDVFLAHSVNDFRYRAEWIPFVFSMAATLLLAAALPGRRAIRGSCAYGAGIVVGAGSIALCLHVAADVNGLSASLYENFVHGAPVFAPLLFVDLAVLAAIGLAAPTGDDWGHGGPP